MAAEGWWVPGRGWDDDDDDEGEGAPAPAWVPAFFTGLIVTGSLRQAVAEAGIDFDTAWALREVEPEFAMYWDRALRLHAAIKAGVPYFEAVAAVEAESLH
jgi:hypothetical protein